MIENLIYGFSVALQPYNLFCCFMGVLYGTLTGVLPGFGPVAAMAILLPITFYFPATTAIILLSGIYYGAMYGGSTTAILLNMPGEAAAIVTCLDGYKMARNGRAGAALGISCIGSFIAGTFGLVGLMVLAPPLAQISLKFGSIEFTLLILFAFSAAILVARGSKLNALIMILLGLLCGTVGFDTLTGVYRFTFGHIDLMDGLGLLPVVMGLFGIGEVLINLEKKFSHEIFNTKINKIFPSRKDLKDSAKPIMRGSFFGFLIGILPGAGAMMASFVSYAMEKKLSKNPEKFGTGVIEGVAGPESANNAATAGAMIPLMTLGIPPNDVIAVLSSAFIMHGIQPGPSLIVKHADLFWGTVISMYIGNVLLVILNMPLIPIWVQFLKTPYKILYPIIVLLCLVGIYITGYKPMDIIIMGCFGIIGYLMQKCELEAAPFIIAFILGPILESNFRQTLILSDGDFSIFLSSHIAVGICFIIALILLSYPVYRSYSLFKRLIKQWISFKFVRRE